jgi:rhamnogalacturonyl hydrolase YesR
MILHMRLAKLVLCAATLNLLPLTAIESEVGLTADGEPILCEHGSHSLDRLNPRKRLVVVGGLDGSAESAYAVRRMYEWFEKSRQALKLRRQFALSVVPLANPDGVRLQFPPQGEAYRQQTESHYLWRWLQVHAPDMVLIAGSDPAGLGQAISSEAASITGRIPAERITEAEDGLHQFLERKGSAIEFSEARKEIQQRLARTPRQVAEQLAKVYGHELPDAVYIPAVALMARLRLGAVADVERIVEPYFSGAKDSLHKASSSHLSGHLVFASLYEQTRKPQYLELVKKAANLGFSDSGEMKESMPMHSEMSDSVFMGCPILAAAGKLTGETKYFDMAVRHFEFMKALTLRPDGIYRHSPLDETAWGRGNGFPALGLALTLSDLPVSHPGHALLLGEFRKHMDALVKFQNEGMWREVIDKPGAYRELTATCMIGFAMQRGISRGWLDRRKFRPLVDRAWRAVNARTSADGKLVDVCTSTGKQKSLQDYLDRTAILGADARGGAMVLLFATELM